MTPPAWILPSGLSGGDADAVHRIADVQHGVVRRQEVLRLGISDVQLDRWLRTGRWQEYAGVVVLHNGELSEVQRQEVATRVGVRLAALAARTAAAAEGLQHWPAPALEVLVPKGCTYPPLPFPVRLHESRRFVEGDLPDRSPRRVRLERAVIDAASWGESDKVAAGLLAAAVQQRLSTAFRLEDELTAGGRLRRRAFLKAVLGDIAGGAQSYAEVAFLRYCVRRGLPRPAMQAMRRDGAGRLRYLDATFVRADGTTVNVEIDGGLHLRAASYWQDMHRNNELALADELELRFPSWMIHADDPCVADQIRRALRLSVPPARLPA